MRSVASKWRALLWILCALAMICIGGVAGIGIASVYNIDESDLLAATPAALPTQVLDRHGALITKFFAEEKRDLISIDSLPRHLINALITREDRTFFQHNGFSVRGTARAIWNQITNSYFSGGSTLTQQLAGHLYADRSEITISRKIKELWWAYHVERYWTKYEILEKYLNTMFFGHGNYGIEAASQFFFGHSARDLTLAESVMLVIQLANPTIYSPIRNPNNARKIQRTVLDQMVELGYTSRADADQSFNEYWGSYDFTRANTSTAFFERDDLAPYFSEYVRYLLENRYLLGNNNINTGGFVVRTTLDLGYQQAARRHISDGLKDANRIYQRNNNRRVSGGDEYIAMVDALALAFNIPDIYAADAPIRRDAKRYYNTEIAPAMEMISLLFSRGESSDLRDITKASLDANRREAQRTIVEGALVTLENGTGNILSMIGGSKFESRNQFNRAIDGRMEPGSSFKPLYYAAAIDKRVITPATMIYDAPVVFWNEDGTAYTPENYKGVWHGPVLARQALANSMNVPSLRVLERVGFDDSLTTARRLLGIPAEDMLSRNLVRRYPVGLGIVELAPIEMAQAYSTFANNGVLVDPFAILYIEDKNGKIVLDLRQQRQKEIEQTLEERQIISPQAAYVMTDLLQSTVNSGTLRYAKNIAGGFTSPVAGKTGTTQNWSDAWTVGFSPYYTTAVWIGFDRGGNNSLGTNQTGAVTAGPIWAKYMSEIHKNLSRREFVPPAEGIVYNEIATRTGLLPPPSYELGVRTEVFIENTEPTEYDTLYSFEQERRQGLVKRLSSNLQTVELELDIAALSFLGDQEVEEVSESDDIVGAGERQGALETQAQTQAQAQAQAQTQTQAQTQRLSNYFAADPAIYGESADGLGVVDYGDSADGLGVVDYGDSCRWAGRRRLRRILPMDWASSITEILPMGWASSITGSLPMDWASSITEILPMDWASSITGSPPMDWASSITGIPADGLGVVDYGDSADGLGVVDYGDSADGLGVVDWLGVVDYGDPADGLGVLSDIEGASDNLIVPVIDDNAEQLDEPDDESDAEAPASNEVIISRARIIQPSNSGLSEPISEPINEALLE